jgi:large conductance mechanosensitive channel
MRLYKSAATGFRRDFLSGLLDFIIIAVVIFLMIRVLAKVKRKEDRLDAVDSKECLYCLSIIPIAASKCAHCTSDLLLAISV